MALHSAIKGKLISVIGDEVGRGEQKDFFVFVNSQNVNKMKIHLQDTCVGFLLGGVGEINKNRHPNFMVVDKSELNLRRKHQMKFPLIASNFRHSNQRARGLLQAIR